MTTKEFLHKRFNKRSSQIPPIRLAKYNRKHMAQLFGELGFERGAEIGVADGQNSLTLCKSISTLKKLYCIDPWKVYPENPRAHDNQDEMLRIAKERLSPYPVEFIPKMSMDAVRNFEPNTLDFVYIDGHHGFDYVMQDLIEWSKIVKKNGIVAGHDYYRFRWAGVVDAVDAYVKAHQIHEWFVTDEKETTFFWAK
jgi:predicted O-methyltransferase YrrM